MLTSDTRTFMQEIMWVSLGTALGALVPAISAIADMQKSPTSFGNWELVECVVFGAAIAVFAIMCYILKKDPNVSKLKAGEIRQRTSRREANE